MKKLVSLFSMLSLVSIHLPLVSCSNSTDRVKKCIERFNIIDGLGYFLGLPDSQPVLGHNWKLVINNTDMFDFSEQEYLNKAFLDGQKNAKNSFAFDVLTTFLKLKPDENNSFDLSNTLLKVENVTYFEIDTKVLPKSHEKIIVFTKGVINFSFLNRTSNAKINTFHSPIKDVEVDIFNKLFSDKFKDQATKNNNYNNFFNVERYLGVSGFEIGRTLVDVKIKLLQTVQLVKDLQNILKNFNLELDNLIKFDVKLNREKSNIDSSETDESLKKRVFKDGDVIDIEFTLSIPNGYFGKDKKNKSLTTDFSITLTKGLLKKT